MPNNKNYKNNNKNTNKSNFNKKKQTSNQCMYAATTTNDPSWYNNYPGLTRDAGSIPFVNFTGVKFNPTGDIPYVDIDYILPGIMKLNYVPTYGIGSDQNDALNVMSNQLYAYMRRANSGSRNYEDPDLMMYFMAVDNAVQLWAFAARIYGLLNHYEVSNRYLPRLLIESMNVDYDDLSKHQADFRSAINRYAAKLNSCPVPKTADIVKRHVYMSTNLYRDHSNSKSQIYYFAPEVLYKFDATKRDTGTCLVPYEMPNDNYIWTWEDFDEAFNTFIDDLLTNEDISIMCGDILKAFTDIFQIGMIDDSYVASILDDEAILAQIHNAKICGKLYIPNDVIYAADGAYTADVYQEDGIIKYNPWVCELGVAASNKPIDYGTILDFYKNESPTPLDVMYLSRLTANISSTEQTQGDKTYVARIESCGSEFITQARIYFLQPDDMSMSFITLNGCIPEDINALTLASKITEFDWHPRFVIRKVWSDQTVQAKGILWESKNIAVVSKENVKNLNEAAILSLLKLV